MTNTKLTDKRTIGARIAALLVADSVPLSDAWKALIDDVDSQEPYGYLEVFDFPRTTATLYPEQDRYAKLPLYIAPQSQTDAEWVELQERRKADNQEPASERERIRREHAEWSDKTFGDVGPIGPLKHLSKEAMEAAANPSDPLEWADMQFLLWDAQRRMGISDEFITRVMIEKLAINKARQWPEPKDGEPQMHIKEQPVPDTPQQ